MAIWSSTGMRIATTSIACYAPSLFRESRATIGDPRSWGFTHGVRRPRPCFVGIPSLP